MRRMTYPGIALLRYLSQRAAAMASVTVDMPTASAPRVLGIDGIEEFAVYMAPVVNAE
jgi:hypothetical protein